jgi:hypothetical protein
MFLFFRVSKGTDEEEKKPIELEEFFIIHASHSEKAAEAATTTTNQHKQRRSFRRWLFVYEYREVGFEREDASFLDSAFCSFMSRRPKPFSS